MSASSGVIDPSIVSAADFRLALRHFASGVTVISAKDASGTIHGMTATAFSSLSLKPPLVLVAIARSTRCHALVTTSRHFGVSVLYEHQTGLSQHFGGKPSPDAAPRFRQMGDIPVLADAMVSLACRLEDSVEAGDHSIFTGLVEMAETVPGRPLIHFDGRYRMLASSD